MATNSQQAQSLRFAPDYAVPPGETLEETLAVLGMSQVDLARRTERSPKNINEIIKGKAPITPEAALQFERVLGVPASFWNNLERNYRARMARLDEKARLVKQGEWAEGFPVRELKKRGLLPDGADKGDTVKHILNFFGVASPAAWQKEWEYQRASLRASPKFQTDKKSLAAWLRQGELEAQRVECRPFDPGKFQEALGRARGLTSLTMDSALPQLVSTCAESGVAVVFVRRFPKLPLHGATRWLSPHKALIQLSIRFRRDDQLWFTFFHEAVHVLRHQRKKTVFLNLDNAGYEEEEEANRVAADWLIPPGEYKDFITKASGRISKSMVTDFAAEQGIAPGIVVGRLQHDGHLPFSHLNDLKVALTWAA